MQILHEERIRMQPETKLRWLSIYRFVNASDEFRGAWDFQLHYEPKEGEDYSWVEKYSQLEFARMLGGVHVLDEKADSLIRYLGAGSVFVSLASLLKSGALPLYVIAPTLILLLLALACAVVARKPQFHPAPPYTREALQFVDFFGSTKGAGARFAAKVGSASVAMKLAGEFKATYIRQAFRFFTWAIVYLVLATLYVQIGIN